MKKCKQGKCIVGYAGNIQGSCAIITINIINFKWWINSENFHKFNICPICGHKIDWKKLEGK